MIGTDAFAKYSALEKGPKYAGKRPPGCAYCASDDHLWLACPRISGFKALQLKGKDSPFTPSPPAPTPTNLEACRVIAPPQDDTNQDNNSDVNTNPSNPSITDYSFLCNSNIFARVLKTVTTICTPSSSLVMV